MSKSKVLVPYLTSLREICPPFAYRGIRRASNAVDLAFRVCSRFLFCIQTISFNLLHIQELQPQPSCPLSDLILEYRHVTVRHNPSSTPQMLVPDNQHELEGISSSLVESRNQRPTPAQNLFLQHSSASKHPFNPSIRKLCQRQPSR